MRLAQAWIVATHDLGLLRQKKTLLAGLVAFPIGVAVGFPALVGLIISRVGEGPGLASILPGLINSFSFWFVVASATLPVAIASYSIVGEKVEKSLEPLLSTPTTDGEILLGKALAAFLPTMLAIGAGSTIYMVLIDRVTRGSLGYLYFPNWEMAVTLLALAPMACLFSIEASILISSRVTDVRTAQQYSGILFLPFILLYVVGEIGLINLNATNLLYISGALALIVLAFFYASRKVFGREEILTRWK